MICPRCQNDVFQTVETKSNFKDNTKRRKRICKQCGLVFLTTETITQVYCYDKEQMKTKRVSISEYEQNYSKYND